MAYTLTNPPSEKCDLTPKNRVWGFFENSNRTRPANRRNPSELRRKNRLTPTKTASGIPYWPSSDPIEEMGGVNLYGFAGNDGVNNTDYLGYEIVSPDETYLKQGDCTDISLGEFIELQKKWGGKIEKNELTSMSYGCVGLCFASQSKGAKYQKEGERMPEYFYLDDRRPTKCWAGRSGKTKAEQEALNCKNSEGALVFAKYGKWQNQPAPKDGDLLDLSLNRIVATDGKTLFDYITKLGRGYYMHSDRANLKEPLKTRVKICRKIPDNFAKEEMWCTSCCDRMDKYGYNNNYKEK